MADSCSDMSTVGRANRRKLNKGAKFNYDFCQVAARMVAAGLDAKEIGQFLGVKPATIASWKQRYEEFQRACKSGKDLAKQYLVANGLRAAMGYDYEEVEEKWEKQYDEETGKYEDVCVERKVKLRHKPVDSALLMFFLINTSEGEYKNTRFVEVTEKKSSLNMNITGQMESDQIRKLAGAAMQKADDLDRSKCIEAEVLDESTD